MFDKTNFRERAATTLQRVAAVNDPVAQGSGLAPDHFVPLGRFHNRAVANKFSQQLEENGIRFQVHKTRMYTFFSVTVEQLATGSLLFKKFQETTPDTRARSFSRDYDAVIIIGLLTLVVATVSFVVSKFNAMLLVAVFVSGISLAIVAERWHRNYRYQEGKHFSLADVMSLTAIFALNFAIWRMVW